MNEKNLAILAQLKAQLIAESQKSTSSNTSVEDSQNLPPSKIPPKKPKTPKKHKRKASPKSTPKKPLEVYPSLKATYSFINGGNSSKFREQNRRMVANQTNIGRNHSHANESLHAYHGGTISPK